MSKPLSPEDRALLQWSGELDGSAPAATARELDTLAASVRRLQSEPAPSRALQDALRRHRQLRDSPPRTARLVLYAVAAAMVVFAAGLLVLDQPEGADPKADRSAATDPDPAPLFLPAAFPESESHNLKRIRDARARIDKIRQRNRKVKPPTEGSRAAHPGRLFAQT